MDTKKYAREHTMIAKAALRAAAAAKNVRAEGVGGLLATAHFGPYPLDLAWLCNCPIGELMSDIQGLIEHVTPEGAAVGEFKPICAGERK